MKRPIPTFKEVAYGEPNVLTKRIWLLFVISGLFVFMNLAYAQQKQRADELYESGHNRIIPVDHGANDSGCAAEKAGSGDIPAHPVAGA